MLTEQVTTLSRYVAGTLIESWHGCIANRRDRLGRCRRCLRWPLGCRPSCRQPHCRPPLLAAMMGAAQRPPIHHASTVLLGKVHMSSGFAMYGARQLKCEWTVCSADLSQQLWHVSPCSIGAAPDPRWAHTSNWTAASNPCHCRASLPQPSTAWPLQLLLNVGVLALVAATFMAAAFNNEPHLVAT